MTLIPNPYAGPARALRESGGTVLPMGAVSEGQFLKRVGSTVVGAAVSAAVPVEAARVNATTLADVFVTFPYVTSFSTNTGISTGQLRARPIVFGRDCTLTSIGVDCSVGVANAKARCGLYEMSADGSTLTLVAESDELDCSTNGRKLTTGLSVALSASKGYWAAAIGGTAAPNLVTIGSANSIGTVVVASGATNISVMTGITVAQAFGALPATFPSGFAAFASATVMPAVLCGVTG